MTQKPKTYVLIGYDNKDEDDFYKRDPNCKIIRFKPGQSIEEAVKAIHPPANIILQCHGSRNAKFEWNKREMLPYTRLFDVLPRNGILSLTLGGCYGGTAQKNDILAAAPPGMLVQSMTGPETPGLWSFTTSFAYEAKGLTNPIDLFLEALDNFDPQKYESYNKSWNKRHPNKPPDDPNPERALPHILGIGGKPPVIIDLAQETSGLLDKQGTAAFIAAVTVVQSRFDTNIYRTGKKDDSLPVYGSLGMKAEKKLDADIAAMAEKLAAGYQPQGAEEKRIAYALTAAYLYESGRLGGMGANGGKKDPAATDVSEKSANFIHDKLSPDAKEKMEEIVTQLGSALSKTASDDSQQKAERATQQTPPVPGKEISR